MYTLLALSFFYVSNQSRESPVFTRELLGEQGFGPCIIEDYDSTIIVNPIWKWEQDQDGNIILQRGSS